MKYRDIISSLFWIVLGAGVCYGAYDLELGAFSNPGPGFIFFWAGLAIVALSLALFIRAIKDEAVPGELKRVFWMEIRWSKIVTVMGALLSYAIIFTKLGFILSTILLLIFLFKAVEPQGWTKVILGSLITTFIVYVVFHLWLRVSFPRGLFGFG